MTKEQLELAQQRKAPNFNIGGLLIHAETGEQAEAIFNSLSVEDRRAWPRKWNGGADPMPWSPRATRSAPSSAAAPAAPAPAGVDLDPATVYARRGQAYEAAQHRAPGASAARKVEDQAEPTLASIAASAYAHRGAVHGTEGER